MLPSLTVLFIPCLLFISYKFNKEINFYGCFNVTLILVEVKNIDAKQSKGTIKTKNPKGKTWNKETQMTGQHEPLCKPEDRYMDQYTILLNETHTK